MVESVVESPNSCGFLLQRGPFLQYLASSIAIPISLPILRKLKQVYKIPMREQQGTNFCETILEKQMPSSWPPTSKLVVKALQIFHKKEFIFKLFLFHENSDSSRCGFLWLSAPSVYPSLLPLLPEMIFVNIIKKTQCHQDFHHSFFLPYSWSSFKGDRSLIDEGSRTNLTKAVKTDKSRNFDRKTISIRLISLLTSTGIFSDTSTHSS